MTSEKVTRGAIIMPKNNYPNAEIDRLPDEFVETSINSLQELAALGKISCKPEQDEEFEQRVSQIIDFCKRKKMRPGIELYALDSE